MFNSLNINVFVYVEYHSDVVWNSIQQHGKLPGRKQCTFRFKLHQLSRKEREALLSKTMRNPDLSEQLRKALDDQYSFDSCSLNLEMFIKSYKDLFNSLDDLIEALHDPCEFHMSCWQSRFFIITNEEKFNNSRFEDQPVDFEQIEF